MTIHNRKDRNVNLEFCERFYGRFEVDGEIRDDYAKFERSMDSKSED